MKTIGQLFSSLSELVANAIAVGFPVPDRTKLGISAMDAEIDTLAESGVDMDPNEVIATTRSITRICESLFSGFVNMLVPFVMDRAEKARRSTMNLESHSYIAGKFFPDELTSLKIRLEDLLDFVSARKADEIDDKEFVVAGVELLGFIYAETTELERKLVEFKRRGVEMKEAKDQEEVKTKPVNVSSILASLGRPVAPSRTGGRSAEKREKDRQRRAGMRGSSSGGGSAQKGRK